MTIIDGRARSKKVRGASLGLRAHANRPARPPLPRRNRRTAGYLDKAPKIVARIASVLGVLSLMDAIWPHRWTALYTMTGILPAPATAAAEAVVAVSGVLLLRVAAGLRRGKRTEWRIAMMVCLALTLADLLREERRPIEATVTVVLFIALVTARSRFRGRSDVHSKWFAARVGAEFAVVAVSYGMVLLLLPGHLNRSVSILARLREVLLSLVGAGGSIPLHGDHFADVFHATLLGFGLLSITCVVVLALRPSEPVATLSGVDEQRLRNLLARHGGRDSLGYFALRRDKAVIWSATGKAAITYRVVSGVALVSGDPIGDPEAWPGVIDAYRRLVADHGWIPAVMGCSELGATVFKRDGGLAALALGDEAILYPASFALPGRAMRGVRQACTRAERAGYAVEVRRVGDVDSTELTELREAAAAWRGDTVERGYSMALSRLGDAADPDCVVATARQHGRLRGLLHFVPWGSDGLSLDLMRRDRASDNGLNEFMITAVVQACSALGIEHVSLNFAVFRDALERGERIGAGPVLRMWRRVLLLASRWWQIDSLYRFNNKFQPQWETRYVSYAAARDLPRITLAALEAEAFIVRPQLLKRVLGRA